MDVVFDRLKKDFFRNFFDNDGDFSDVSGALAIFNRAEVIKQHKVRYYKLSDD